MANQIQKLWTSVINAFAAEESRSLENPSIPVSSFDTWDDLISQTESAGEKVTPETAMRLSAIYSAILIIAESISVLPLTLKRSVAHGSEQAKDHRLWHMLATSPNEFQTWYMFFLSLITDALRYGNGYARIVRDGTGAPRSLEYLEHGECEAVFLKIGRQKYLYYYVDGEMVEKRDIIHITSLGNNGIIGKSPIMLHKEGISLGLASEKFGARFFGSGAHSSGGFSTPTELSDSAFKRLHRQLKEKYAGLRNSHTPMLLEGGLKYERFSIPPNEAQFIETRKFQIAEIARIFRVPLHKLQELDRATNNNIEQQTQDFKDDCLFPWVERIEQEIKRKLLLDSEQEDYWFEFDMDYALRPNPVNRATYFEKRFNTGSITPNEIREREGDNRRDNPLSDETFIQSGFQPLREENFKPKTVTTNEPIRGNQKRPKPK